MDEQKVRNFIYAATRIITDQLSELELATLYNAVTGDFNPKGVMGYEKARPLFTEANETRMHRETFLAFEQIVGERIQ